MASSASSLPFQCKWGFCTDRFSEQGVLRAHVQSHVKQETFIRVEDLDVEIRQGQWYAREKESQGFGTFVQDQPRASNSNFVSQPSTSSSHSHSSTFLSRHTDESLTQPYTDPSQITNRYPLPASLGPPPTSVPSAAAAAVVLSPTHTDLSTTSDLIPNSPATMSSSTSHSPVSGAPAAIGTPSPQRRTSGGFGTLPLGKKSVFGFGGNALRFGFGGGGAGSSSSESFPSSGVVPSTAPAPLIAPSEAVVEGAKDSSQDSNATRASLTSSANQTSPSSLGAQTQLEIQAVLAAHHSSQRQHSSPPSPSQHPHSSPSSSPHSLLGRQTQGEFTNRRHTPFASSPPSNANDLSPSPTSQHRFLSPSAYENANENEDQDDEDQDGDAFMQEFLVDDFESADGERTNKGKGKGKAQVEAGSSDAEQEELVEDELMTQAAQISRKGR